MIAELTAWLKERIAAESRDQDYWIAVHALGLDDVEWPRKAEIDPLGMTNAEDFAHELTDEELSDLAEQGYDDYWETAGYEAHDSYEAAAGSIDALRSVLKKLEEQPTTRRYAVAEWDEDDGWWITSFEAATADDAVKAYRENKEIEGYTLEETPNIATVRLS